MLKLKKYFLFVLLSSIFSNSMNMDLLSFIDFGQNTSDITGFNQDGREFAVVGLQNSAAFVDISFDDFMKTIGKEGFIIVNGECTHGKSFKVQGNNICMYGNK